MKTLIVAAVLGLQILFVAQASAREKMKVTFVSPSSKNDFFWKKVVGFMQATAKDLKIDLKVTYTGSGIWTDYVKDTIRELEQEDAPDYLIHIFSAGIGTKIFNLAEKNNIKQFVINSDKNKDPENIFGDVGSPRGRYKQWLGHIFPDDQQAGYELAKQLATTARSRNLFSTSDGKTHMVAIAGSLWSSPSTE